jgi:hypothetical protein
MYTKCTAVQNGGLVSIAVSMNAKLEKVVNVSLIRGRVEKVGIL